MTAKIIDTRGGTLQTVNATQTNIVTWTPIVGSARLAKATILGRSVGGLQKLWILQLPGIVIGNPGDLVGAVPYNQTAGDVGTGTWAAELIDLAGVYTVRVTGQAATTINWICRLDTAEFVP